MRRALPTRSPRAARLLRAALLLALATALLAGLGGGLLRAGVPWAPPGGPGWPTRALLGHAFLMMSAFMGSLIGVERAVAMKAVWAWLAPGASALAGVALLAGTPAGAGALGVAGAGVFVAVNTALLRRQRAGHAALALVGAVAWLVGNLLYAAGEAPAAAVPWWFAFLVLTIAAERLEMSRLMRQRRGAAPALHACVAALLAGAALGAVTPAWGGLLYGAALLGLALWLAVSDIARRTVRAQGLSRYMAVSLLAGYAWLAVAGVAWMAAAAGLAARDVALHALGLGFVFSMMLGHAPVILPALTGVKVRFGRVFYLPWALLHGSLLLRFAGVGTDPSLWAAGAMAHVAAIAVFALTMAGAAWAWRIGHPVSPRGPHASPARH